MTSTAPCPFHSWLCQAVIGTALIASSFPAWNLAVDPFHVFDSRLLQADGSSLNERFLKMRHLLSGKKRYQGLILGTSTVGAIAPSLLDREIPGKRFYNLGFAAARPDEILAFLKTLHRHGITPDTVLYGLEPGPFHTLPESGFAAHHHYAVTGEHPVKLLLDFLTAPSFGPGLSRITESLQETPSIRYDIEETGRYYLSKYDAEIASDLERFVQNRLSKQTPPVFKGLWKDDEFAKFGNLVQWFRDNGVVFHLYLSPLHPALQRVYGKNRLEYFKRRLLGSGKLTGLADCTRLLDADADSSFYDLKHFRPAAVPRLLRCAVSHKKH